MIEHLPIQPSYSDRYKPENHPILNPEKSFAPIGVARKPHLLEHDIDDSKAVVVRIELDRAQNLGKILEESTQFSNYLQEMRDKWGIPTLEPEFAIGEDTLGSRNLYCLVQKVPNAKQFEEVIENKIVSELDQYRELAVRLGAMLTETVEQGGYIYPEIMRLDQYVTKDQRDEMPMLVDVTPESGVPVHANMSKEDGVYAIDHIEDSIRWLAEDCIYLETAINDGAKPTYQALNQAVFTAYSHGLLREGAYIQIKQAIENDDPSLVSAENDWWHELD